MFTRHFHFLKFYTSLFYPIIFHIFVIRHTSGTVYILLFNNNNKVLYNLHS
jgi:hypothetical protein